jgi:hypothetical protein
MVQGRRYLQQARVARSINAGPLGAEVLVMQFPKGDG